MAVRDEVLAAPAGTLGLDRIAEALADGWLQAAPLVVGGAQQVAPETLGRGEWEALVLAEELGIDLFITDDAEARSEATAAGLEVTGTLGVLTLAREREIIPAVLPLLLELRNLGQWIGDDLIQAVRTQELADGSD